MQASMVYLKGSTIRVCHVTSVHSAFDVRIFHKECRSLSQTGIDVAIIAPENLEGTDTIVKDDIRIIRIPIAHSRKDRFTRTAFHLYQMTAREDADVYHFHDPELIPLGFYLHAKGKKVIYDVHEDTSLQIMGKNWIPPLLRTPLSQFVRYVENIQSKIGDGIIAATPAIAQRFPIEKTITVQNFPLLTEMDLFASTPYAQRPNQVLYLGGLSTNRGVAQMVDAMSLVPLNLRVRLALAGSFSSNAFEKAIRQLPGWRHVDFHGWQARLGISELLNQARIGIVVLHPALNFLESYPVKLFEYMAAGIPVIASDFPLWREIVNDTGCGLLVDPLNPVEIAQAIEFLLTHPREAEEMGRRGQKAIREKYNWDIEARKLVNFYRQLMQ